MHLDLGNGFLSNWKASSQNHPKEDVVLWSISLCECMFNHPKLDRCLTNWAKKKINPQTKLAVYPLINFDNLWETRKAVSIRDICPVSLIPSVFQQAVSAIQAHMVIYNSRDSTPKINCYWQTFTYQRTRKRERGGAVFTAAHLQKQFLLLCVRWDFCIFSKRFLISIFHQLWLGGRFVQTVSLLWSGTGRLTDACCWAPLRCLFGQRLQEMLWQQVWIGTDESQHTYGSGLLLKQRTMTSQWTQQKVWNSGRLVMEC